MRNIYEDSHVSMTELDCSQDILLSPVLRDCLAAGLWLCTLRLCERI